MKRFGLKGQRSVKQLIRGFPIIGILPQESTYPVANRDKSNITTPQELLGSSHSRFWGREASANSPRDGELWGEAIGQFQKGWIDNQYRLG